MTTVFRIARALLFILSVFMFDITLSSCGGGGGGGGGGTVTNLPQGGGGGPGVGADQGEMEMGGGINGVLPGGLGADQLAASRILRNPDRIAPAVLLEDTNSDSNPDIITLSGENLTSSGLDSQDLDEDLVLAFLSNGEEIATCQSEDGVFNAPNIDLDNILDDATLDLEIRDLEGEVLYEMPIPLRNFEDGDAYRFKIVLRADGSFAVGIFVDNNSNGISDNGNMVVIDSGSIDVDGDDTPDTVSYMVSSDGLYLLDGDNNGIYGEDGPDSLFDFNDDGSIDQNDPSTFVDSNRDGDFNGEGDERSGTPEDSVTEIEIVPLNGTARNDGSYELNVPQGVNVSVPTFVFVDYSAHSPYGSTISFSFDGEASVPSGQFSSTVEADLGNGRTFAFGPVFVPASEGGEGNTFDVTVTASLNQSEGDVVSDSFVLHVTIVPNVIPTVESLSPDSGAAGTLFSITGTGFSAIPGDNVVTVDGVLATVTSSSNTQINAIVPTGTDTEENVEVRVLLNGNISPLHEGSLFFVNPSGPSLLNLSPNLAQTVPNEAAIAMLFSQQLDFGESDPRDFIKIFRGNLPENPDEEDGIDGDFDTDNNPIILFTPDDDDEELFKFQDDTTYTLYISTELQGLFDGANFDQIPGGTLNAFSLTFNVGDTGDETGPQVTDVSVSDEETNVSPSASFTVIFDEPINPASINPNSFFLFDEDENLIEGSYSFPIPNGVIPFTRISFTPDSDLVGSSQYILILDEDVTDTSGNSLQEGFIHFFMTGMQIQSLSPISGPGGTEVEIRVNGLGLNPSNNSVFIGEQAIDVETIAENEDGTHTITGTIPTDAQTGDVLVTRGDIFSNGVEFVITEAGVAIESLGLNDMPSSVALSPNGREAYVTNQGVGRVSVLDVSQGIPSFLQEIPVGSGSALTELVYSQDGSKIFVLNFGSATQAGNTVFVIDADSRVVTDTISVGSRPTRLALNQTGSRLYVTNFGDDTVSVIDTSSLDVVATFNTGTGPDGVAISPNGLKGYICNYFDDSVTVFNPQNNLPVDRIQVGQGPARVAISPDGARAYVTNFLDNTVSVIQTATNRVINTIGVNQGPADVEFSPNGDTAFIAARSSNVVSRIDTSTLETKLPLPAGAGPSGLAVSLDGSYLYTTNLNSDELSVIFLNKPVHTLLSLDPPFCDPGVDAGLTILGSNFSEDALVYINGVNAPITGFENGEDGVDSLFLNTIPANAVSGSLTVVINGVVSNALNLTVTPVLPRLVSSFPVANATQVPVNGSVFVTFNEPMQADSVNTETFRLFLVGGAQVNPQSISALDAVPGYPDFAKTFRFTPNGNLNANAQYRVELDGTEDEDDFIRDRSGFAIDGNLNNEQEDDVVFFFNTVDTSSPLLNSVLFDDNDSNGVDAGDFVYLGFNESVNLAAGVTPSQLFTIQPTGNFGTGATVTKTGSNQLRVTLGSNSALVSAGVFLGEGDQINPDLVTLPNLTPNGIRVNSGQTGVRDAANNNASSSSALDVDVNDEVSPVLQQALYVDADGNQSVTGGDTVTLVFSEPLAVNLTATATSLLGADTLNQLGGATFIAPFSPNDGFDGNNATIVQLASDRKRLVITVGSGAHFTPNGVFNPGNILNGDPSGVNIGENAASRIVDMRGLPVVTNVAVDIAIDPAGALGPRVQSALFIDSDSNGLVGQNDRIRLTFNPTFTVRNGFGSATNDFNLPVSGDSFGAGATASNGPNANQIDVILGNNPSLRVRGTFSEGAAGNGSASGIDLRAIYSATLQGSAGVATDLPPIGSNGQGVDITAQDVTGPVLQSSTYSDANENGQFDQGDKLLLNFNSPVFLSTTGLPASQLFALPVTGNRFGNGATVQTGDGANQLEILLGSAPIFNFGGTFSASVLTAGSPSGINVSSNLGGSSGLNGAITDFAGNNATAGAQAIDIGSNDNNGPYLSQALWKDSNNSGGINSGDKVFLIFSEDVIFNTTFTPADLQLPVLNDTFGSGALFASDGPRTGVITLGQNPILRVHGIFNSGFSSVGSASGIDVFTASRSKIKDRSGNNYGANIVTAEADLGSSDNIGPKISSALFNDVTNDGVINKGDRIRVTFNEGIVLLNPANALPGDNFTLPVSDNTFGEDATLSVDAADSKVIRIVLGSNPALTVAGVFNPNQTGSGKPSGLDALSGPNVIDISGNTALQNAVDIAPLSSVGPTIVTSYFLDSVEDIEQVVNPGDDVVVQFNRPVNFQENRPRRSFFLPVSGDSLGNSLVDRENFSTNQLLTPTTGSFQRSAIAANENQNYYLSAWIVADETPRIQGRYINGATGSAPTNGTASQTQVQNLFIAGGPAIIDSMDLVFDPNQNAFMLIWTEDGGVYARALWFNGSNNLQFGPASMILDKSISDVEEVRLTFNISDESENPRFMAVWANRDNDAIESTELGIFDNEGVFVVDGANGFPSIDALDSDESPFTTHPGLAASPWEDRFLVAWREEFNLSVQPSDDTFSHELPGSENFYAPEVVYNSMDEVFWVFAHNESAEGGGIAAWEIYVGGPGPNVDIEGPFELSTGGNPRNIRGDYYPDTCLIGLTWKREHGSDQAIYAGFVREIEEGDEEVPQLILENPVIVRNNFSMSRPEIVFNPERNIFYVVSVAQGEGNRVAGQQLGLPPFLTRGPGQNELTITLGTDCHLTVDGSYSPTALSSGNPSGIDVSSSIPAGSVIDALGNTAQALGAPGSSSSGVDIQDGDVVPPFLVAALYTDAFGSGLGAGDVIAAVFSEPVELYNSEGEPLTPLEFLSLTSNPMFNLQGTSSATLGAQVNLGPLTAPAVAKLSVELLDSLFPQNDLLASTLISNPASSILSQVPEEFRDNIVLIFLGQNPNLSLVGTFGEDAGATGLGLISSTSLVRDTGGNNASAQAVVDIFSIGDTIQPFVVDVYTDETPSGIPTTTNLEVEFSESIDPTSLSGQISLSLFPVGEGTPTPVPFGTELEGNILFVNPTNDLLADREYLLVISTGIRDFAGNFLAEQFSFDFGVSETVNPAPVSAFIPSNNEGLPTDAFVPYNGFNELNLRNIHDATVRVVFPENLFFLDQPVDVHLFLADGTNVFSTNQEFVADENALIQGFFEFVGLDFGIFEDGNIEISAWFDEHSELAFEDTLFKDTLSPSVEFTSELTGHPLGESFLVVLTDFLHTNGGFGMNGVGNSGVGFAVDMRQEGSPIDFTAALGTYSGDEFSPSLTGGAFNAIEFYSPNLSQELELYEVGFNISILLDEGNFFSEFGNNFDGDLQTPGNYENFDTTFITEEAPILPGQVVIDCVSKDFAKPGDVIVVKGAGFEGSHLIEFLPSRDFGASTLNEFSVSASNYFDPNTVHFTVPQINFSHQGNALEVALFIDGVEAPKTIWIYDPTTMPVGGPLSVPTNGSSKWVSVNRGFDVDEFFGEVPVHIAISENRHDAYSVISTDGGNVVTHYTDLENRNMNMDHFEPVYWELFDAYDGLEATPGKAVFNPCFPDVSKIYVPLRGLDYAFEEEGEAFGNLIAVLDANNPGFVDFLALPEDIGVNRIAVSPDGRRLFAISEHREFETDNFSLFFCDIDENGDLDQESVGSVNIPNTEESLHSETEIVNLRVSPDGRFVLVCGGHGDFESDGFVWFFHHDETGLVYDSDLTLQLTPGSESTSMIDDVAILPDASGYFFCDCDRSLIGEVVIDYISGVPDHVVLTGNSLQLQNRCPHIMQYDPITRSLTILHEYTSIFSVVDASDLLTLRDRYVAGNNCEDFAIVPVFDNGDSETNSGDRITGILAFAPQPSGGSTYHPGEDEEEFFAEAGFIATMLFCPEGTENDRGGARLNFNSEHSGVVDVTVFDNITGLPVPNAKVFITDTSVSDSPVILVDGQEFLEADAFGRLSFDIDDLQPFGFTIDLTQPSEGGNHSYYTLTAFASHFDFEFGREVLDYGFHTFFDIHANEVAIGLEPAESGAILGGFVDDISGEPINFQSPFIFDQILVSGVEEHSLQTLKSFVSQQGEFYSPGDTLFFRQEIEPERETAITINVINGSNLEFLATTHRQLPRVANRLEWFSLFETGGDGPDFFLNTSGNPGSLLFNSDPTVLGQSQMEEYFPAGMASTVEARIAVDVEGHTIKSYQSASFNASVPNPFFDLGSGVTLQMRAWDRFAETAEGTFDVEAELSDPSGASTKVILRNLSNDDLNSIMDQISPFLMKPVGSTLSEGAMLEFGEMGERPLIPADFGMLYGHSAMLFAVATIPELNSSNIDTKYGVLNYEFEREHGEDGEGFNWVLSLALDFSSPSTNMGNIAVPALPSSFFELDFQEGGLYTMDSEFHGIPITGETATTMEFNGLNASTYLDSGMRNRHIVSTKRAPIHVSFSTSGGAFDFTSRDLETTVMGRNLETLTLGSRQNPTLLRLHDEAKILIAGGDQLFPGSGNSTAVMLSEGAPGSYTLSELGSFSLSAPFQNSIAVEAKFVGGSPEEGVFLFGGDNGNIFSPELTGNSFERWMDASGGNYLVDFSTQGSSMAPVGRTGHTVTPLHSHDGLRPNMSFIAGGLDQIAEGLEVANHSFFGIYSQEYTPAGDRPGGDAEGIEIASLMAGSDGYEPRGFHQAILLHDQVAPTEFGGYLPTHTALILLMGGERLNGSDFEVLSSVQLLVVDYQDPSTAGLLVKVIDLSSMLRARSHFSATLISDMTEDIEEDGTLTWNIFAAGGRDSHSAFFGHGIDDTEFYTISFTPDDSDVTSSDFNVNHHEGPELNVGRFGHTAAVFNDQIFLFGGTTHLNFNGQISTPLVTGVIESFYIPSFDDSGEEPEFDEMTFDGFMLEPRTGHRTMVMNGAIFNFGGLDSKGLIGQTNFDAQFWGFQYYQSIIEVFTFID